MKDAVLSVLRALFGSKKFLALLAGAIVWVVAKAGLDLSTDDVMPFIVLVSSYLVGQGVADFGKESARVSAEVARDLSVEKKN